MQTQLSKKFLSSQQGKMADSILRSCVHCGFCLATCPTYQLLGNELDSPRGRIYLIKQVLEGEATSQESRLHLDRCLTCRSCESTCPSGVKYAQLLDIGREVIEQQVPRSFFERSFRYGLRYFLTSPTLFNSLVKIMPFVRHSKASIPLINKKASKGRVLLLTGCVQPALAPNINRASINICRDLGFEVLETAQKSCCGAIDHHLSAPKSALKQIKKNIDDWSHLIEQGIDAIISNASGCGVMIQDYPHLLKDDPVYAKKALKIAQITQDIGDFLSQQDLSAYKIKETKNISFQAPCTLQHGLKKYGMIEKILTNLGYQLNPIKDPHLCCGSAGTYSIFQPKISNQLRTRKLSNLEQVDTDLIVSANIGCIIHLQKGTKTPVKHWVELLLN